MVGQNNKLTQSLLQKESNNFSTQLTKNYHFANKIYISG